jgi:two-component system response regulator NreC
MTRAGKIRVLLAEDHVMVREGVKLLLQSQPDMEIVGEAGNGRDAVILAQELLPDVVAMDVSMPDLNGYKATVALSQTCPEIKVVAVTRHTDKGYLQKLLEAGAAGYVLKQSSPSELIRAIRAVAAGHTYLDPAITDTAIGDRFSKRSKEPAAAGAHLSERETEVLRLTAWGYSNKEIAARLRISVKTVEVHKANAMRKMEMRGRIDIVRYAILQGWLQDT